MEVTKKGDGFADVRATEQEYATILESLAKIHSGDWRGIVMIRAYAPEPNGERVRSHIYGKRVSKRDISKTVLHLLETVMPKEYAEKE